MQVYQWHLHASYLAVTLAHTCGALQDCNLALLNGLNQTIFASGTAGAGSQPCRLVVSGAGGGGLAVLDSTNATLYFEGAYSPPGTLPGTLPTGTLLKQVLPNTVGHAL